MAAPMRYSPPAAHLLDDAELFQRGEQARHRALRQADALGDLGDTRRPAGQHPQHGEGALDGLDGGHGGRPIGQQAPSMRAADEGVLQQAGDGHRAGAAGHRGDGAGDGLDGVEIHVADDAGLGARDTDVDHRGAGLDMGSGDHPRLAGAGDDDVGLTADLDHVVDGRARVGQGDRAVHALAAEQQHLGEAGERAAPDDGGPLAAGGHAVAFEQAHHTQWGAADMTGQAAHEAAHRALGEPVDVLLRRDQRQHGLGVEAGGQRQAGRGCRAPLGSAASSATASSTWAWPAWPGSSTWREIIPALWAILCLLRT